MKKIIKLKFIQHLLSIIAAIYIFLVRITSNIQIINLKIPKNYWDNRKPFILAFWHSQLMMISFTWTNKYKINIIASNHSDGRFGALVGRFFKLNNIPRSSKNSNASLKIIYKLVKNNEYIGITPDGPRGPKEKIKEGLVSLIKKTGVPIIPLSYSAKFKIKFRSWDNFIFVTPLNKFVAVWGNPISFNQSKSLTYNLDEIEKELHRVTLLSDNLSK